MNDPTLTFLGTAAADFSPRLLSDLKDRFDKDARRASSALLAGRYLIDAGPHVRDGFRFLHLDPSCVSDVFLTHFHGDHFQPATLAWLAEGRKTPLRVYCRADAEPAPIPGIVFLPLTPFAATAVDEALTVTALPANHGENTHPEYLVFELAGKKFLYALDGAWMRNDTFCALKNAHLDLAVFDATVGDYVGDHRASEHNSIPMLRLLLPSLRTIGAIDDRTAVYLSHLAPSLHVSHDETEGLVAPDGMHVAYDGLTITI